MGTWRRMAYSRLLSLRGDRRETANDDSRRSRPAVDRSCRPKGGMNDQLTYIRTKSTEYILNPYITSTFG